MALLALANLSQTTQTLGHTNCLTLGDTKGACELRYRDMRYIVINYSVEKSGRRAVVCEFDSMLQVFMGSIKVRREAYAAASQGTQNAALHQVAIQVG